MGEPVSSRRGYSFIDTKGRKIVTRFVGFGRDFHGAHDLSRSMGRLVSRRYAGDRSALFAEIETAAGDRLNVDLLESGDARKPPPSALSQAAQSTFPAPAFAHLPSHRRRARQTGIRPLCAHWFFHGADC